MKSAKMKNFRRKFRSMRHISNALILFVALCIGSIVPALQYPASAAPGDGHMLLFWDGGSAPAGWTCVSCTIGDAFYDTFPRGNDTYGANGGSLTHNHTVSSSIAATTAAAASDAQSGTVLSSNSHAHTVSVTPQAASNLPSYRQLHIIRSNTSGEPTTIPGGAIGIFDASLPSGWSAYSAQNGYFVRGGSSAGSTGGSNTHNHALTISIGSATGGTYGTKNPTNTNSANVGHGHTASGNSDSVDNQPPYISVILGKAGSDTSPPDGLLAMWDDDAPSNWTKQSGSAGAFNQRFLKAAASFGSTGGNSTHSHGTTVITTSGPTGGITSSRSGSGTASATHTHDITVSNYSTEDHTPPYRDVIISKRVPQPEIRQSAYRFFINSDTTDVGSALSSQDTLASAPRQGKPFRLRLALHIATANLGAGNKNFKLQYAARSGTCDVGFSGESYADVSPSSGDIRFYDNGTPADGAGMTTNANDPVHSSHTSVAQTYEEANNATVATTIPSGQDGVWDFSLTDFSAPASTSYCFRLVTSNDVVLNGYDVIPEIATDDGSGHMLLMWDGGSIPSGWSCVSCSAGQDFYQRFFRGASAYGATGGSATHAHTATGSIGTTAGTIDNQAGSGVSTSTHTHSFSPIIGSANSLPAYRQLKIIRAETSGVPSSLPAGAIALFDASVPSGWTRYSAQDGSYIRGEGTAGTTGGSNTHTHSITGTTTGASGQAGAGTNGGTGPSASDGHTHTVSGSTAAIANEPPYISTILGKLSTDSSVPQGIITLWDNPIPGSWVDVSSSGQPFNQKFVKPAVSYGATGGATTHAPGTTVVTSSAPNITGIHRTGGTNAGGSHTHQVTVDNFSSGSNLPPYIDVYIAKLANPNSAPNAPSNLAQTKPSDLSTISVGGYANSGQVTFTADADDPDSLDDLQLCVEAVAVGNAFSDSPTQCGSLASYSGSAISVTMTLSSLNNGVGYHWQARIKDGSGATSSWVSFGGNAETQSDFVMDSVDPSGNVYDGSTSGVDYEYNDGSLDSLSANWNITDGGSGISGFEYAIGTSAGGNDVIDWTSVSLSTSVTLNSLNLETSETYFFTIRASDAAGNKVDIPSDGQQVAPTLSFSVSGGSINIGNVNAANNFTTTTDATVTTSTNARNGYVVRAFTTAALASSYGDSIGMFPGGSYASPAAWYSGVYGFGYTSSDSQIQGVNKFSPATCPGGGSPPCFAPFSQAAPGDIIADNQNTISGTPITNESFTITQRVSVDPSQPTGRYTSVLVFSAAANY